VANVVNFFNKDTFARTNTLTLPGGYNYVGCSCAAYGYNFYIHPSGFTDVVINIDIRSWTVYTSLRLQSSRQDTSGVTTNIGAFFIGGTISSSPDVFSSTHVDYFLCGNSARDTGEKCDGSNNCRGDCLACTSGYDDCDGDGICEILTSTTGCGSCSNNCNSKIIGATPVCSAGNCDYTQCLPNYGDCDGVRSNGCETDLRTSAAHCNECNKACPTPLQLHAATSTCVASACNHGACTIGWDNCDGDATNGCELDVTADVNNCGSCGTNCTSAAMHVVTASCAANACTYSGACAAGYHNCNDDATDGCETSTSAHVDHCGSCTTVCPVDATCANSVCGTLPTSQPPTPQAQGPQAQGPQAQSPQAQSPQAQSPRAPPSAQVASGAMLGLVMSFAVFVCFLLSY